MDEKELLQKIKDDAEQIHIPDRLQPKAIEEMLKKDTNKKINRDAENLSTEEKIIFKNTESCNAADNAASEHTNASKTPKDTMIDHIEDLRKRRQTRSRVLRYGSAAAVFVLAAAVLLQSQRIEKHRNAEEMQVAQNVTEMQDTAKTDDTTPKVQSFAVSDETAPEADEVIPEVQVSQETDEAKLETQVSPKTDEVNPETEAAPRSDPFTYASSAEDIYKTLYNRFYKNSTDENGAYNPSSMTRTELAVPEMELAQDAGGSMEDLAFGSSEDSAYAAPQEATGTEFSGTNLQEANVDEGDIVKTDGSYIYILRHDLSFAIAEVKKGTAALLQVTALPIGDNGYVHEMYLDGDTLYIIASESIAALENEGDVYYTNTTRQTKLLTYDISDRSAPELRATVTQEGSYETSRKNNGYLYLFTNYSPDIRDNFEDSVIMPRVNDKELLAENIYLPESLESTSYLIISSVNTQKPEQIADSKALVSGASHYYVRGENIYIANERYDASVTSTEITKFHYTDGQITGVAAGLVKGYLNNAFSMNEYDGKLRVVSTYTGDEYNEVRDFIGTFTGENYEQSWEEHNALYVLDEDMQQIGAIEDLAEGETIRSARFFGDIGYFVTFEQTDPLFSVDLSDPANPQILGELKVSGFSSYLHFYGENLLLGIGYEADEQTGTIEGLKLSMFDISDPSDVKEVHRTVIPGITWCPAIEDYKSILVEPEKNLIGFYCDNRYLAFSYDEKEGFASELVYDFYSDLLINQADYNTMRGLYIDDTFYLAGGSFLISFDMENGFEKTDVMKIDR